METQEGGSQEPPIHRWLVRSTGSNLSRICNWHLKWWRRRVVSWDRALNLCTLNCLVGIPLVWCQRNTMFLHQQCNQIIDEETFFCIGDCSVWCGPSSHSERPVESKVWHTGPTLMDRFSHGESGLHFTQATLRFAFAKTPSAWIEAANVYCISLK